MTINYSKQVLLKRGNSAVSSTYVGPLGEVTVDTDLDAIRVHDGVTPGGHLSTSSESSATAPATPRESNLWYDTVGGRLYIYYAGAWVDASPAGDVLLNANVANLAALVTGLTSDVANVETHIDSLDANIGAFETAVNVTVGTINANINTLNQTIAAFESNVGPTSDAWVDDAPPDISNVGALWYDAESGRLYVYYDGAWIDANPPVTTGFGNVLPSANVTYSLGSEQYQWKDLWVSNNTIYIGNTPITVSNGSLLVGGNVVSGGGNPFNQNLNTTDAATFANVSATIGFISQINGTNPGGELVIQTDGTHNWIFDANGTTTFPGGGHISATKGGTALDAGYGYNTSLTTFYANANYAACVTGDAQTGTLNITAYNDGGPNPSRVWSFDKTGTLTFPTELSIESLAPYYEGAPVTGTVIQQTANTDLNLYSIGANARTVIGWLENTLNSEFGGNVAEIQFNNFVGEARIVTGEYGNQVNGWQFRADGNLVLPPNSYVLNSDDSIYGGGGGAADTGNIVFSGSSIGLDEGSAEAADTYINISPNGEGWAYLQLPNDTSANVTDTRLWNSAGNVEIGTGDFSNLGESYTWNFNKDGSLTFPDYTVQTTAWTGNLVSATVPTIGGTASAGEEGITYLSGGLSKWAIFTEGAFTVGVWDDVQEGWTVTDNNGFTDTIAGRGSFGAASFSTTVNNWPSPASGKTYVFTSPDYQQGYTNPIEITVGNNAWTFDANGALTFPGGNITIASNIDGGGTDAILGSANASVVVVVQGESGSTGLQWIENGLSNPFGSNVAAVALNGPAGSTPGTVQILTGAVGGSQYTWEFGSGGVTTFPSNLIIGSNPLNPGTVIYQADAGMTVAAIGNAATYIGWSEFGYEPGNIALAAFNDTTGAVAIQTGATTGPEAFNEWIFDADGTLTFPIGGNLIFDSSATSVIDGVTSITAAGNVTAAQYNFANGVNIFDTITGVTSISTSVTTGTYSDTSGDFSYGLLGYSYAVNGVSNSFEIQYSAPLVYGNVDISVGNVTTSGTANVANLIISGSAPSTLTGNTGDRAGMIRVDSNYIYYCTSTFSPSSYTVGWGGATSNTIFLVKGSYPTPQVGWTVSQNIYTFTIDTVVEDGGDPNMWRITYIGVPYGSAAGGTATLTNPNPATIWTQTPLAATTYANSNITAYLAGNVTTGNISATQYNFTNGANILANVATKVISSWTVATGTNTYSFTVPLNGTYQLWVIGNIPSGIIAWNATATVTNNNVPVVGAQYAWVYDGAGTPIDFTSIPNQFVGTANTIVRSSSSPSITTNRFDFGINNTSGGAVTVTYGYIKLNN